MKKLILGSLLVGAVTVMSASAWAFNPHGHGHGKAHGHAHAASKPAAHHAAAKPAPHHAAAKPAAHHAAAHHATAHHGPAKAGHGRGKGIWHGKGGKNPGAKYGLSPAEYTKALAYVKAHH
ncbi:MAG: hypothetical protein P4L46_20880, partial [Fimbriimonas sp.]|nr:hypothetical protein [Fimbriimonas sp.]